jgi:hypothetical protein
LVFSIQELLCGVINNWASDAIIGITLYFLASLLFGQFSGIPGPEPLNKELPRFACPLIVFLVE